MLWLRTARSAGTQPDLRRTTTLRLVSFPLAIASAVLMLGATGVL